ncbi:MAG: DUF4292 domain-containing protein [Bacteroidaceae bacterium]|nr:DUF4292 domain-containing protein [Bacteroidaceae bacterium]
MNKKIIIAIMLVALLSSCGKHRKGDSSQPSSHADSSYVMDEKASSEHFDKVQAYATTADNLVAKVRATITLGDDKLSTNGTIKMRKGKGIQISLVDPVLGILEFGKLVFTESEVIVIVRVKKQYGRVPYSQVSFLHRANITFNSLQALFWHELFQPGVAMPDPKAFVFAPDKDNVNVMLADDMLSYLFITDASGLITKTEITGTQDKRYRLWFDYADFSDFSRKRFPKDMRLSFTDGSRTTSIRLELNSLKNNPDWELSTTIPDGYEKIDFEKIFNNLMMK